MSNLCGIIILPFSITTWFCVKIVVCNRDTGLFSCCLWAPVSYYTFVLYAARYIYLLWVLGPKPPPKRCLHIVRSRASSFKWEYPLLSLRSSSSFLRLLPRLLATSIFIYHIIYHNQISAFYQHSLCVLYGSNNKRWLFPYTVRLLCGTLQVFKYN